ncbi:MAG TPA: hypothetical protein VMA30_09285 [Xanthobacteraceae bacterium]|nr:hypothetical protein [Xanthobacteraceae bacterium]
MAPDERPDIETLVHAIACSPIVVAHAVVARAVPARVREAMRGGLPEGFDDADLTMLHWIAQEGRRAGRRLSKH